MEGPKLRILLYLGLLVALAGSGLQSLLRSSSAPEVEPRSQNLFRRISTLPVYLNSNPDHKTAAEVVVSTDDGTLLIYNDSQAKRVGFVDISAPDSPRPAGVIPVDGEPTSVAVAGRYALAAIDTTSGDFSNPSGAISVIEIGSRRVVRTLQVGGQPDSIDVAPSGTYAAVAIENQRDESLVIGGVEGGMPQAPAGYLAVVDLSGDPTDWQVKRVELVGLADVFPSDPEPEFVDIDSRDIAAVTLQENNHVVLVDLPTGEIVSHFNAGSVDLDRVDTSNNRLIELDGSLGATRREPDGISWLPGGFLVTANEGDLIGGTRSFSIFDSKGSIVFESAQAIEHLVARLGHHNDRRAEKKGNEPETTGFGSYDDGSSPLLFVSSERSSVVAVYRLENREGRLMPALLQTLPTEVAPEGIVPIPHRNLLAIAAEEDDRERGFRSAISLYQWSSNPTNYPTLTARERADGLPIPWGALSGLSGHRSDPSRLYAVHNGVYRRSRIFVIDSEARPASIVADLEITDPMGLLSDRLDDETSTALINPDGSVNLNATGIAVTTESRFWAVSKRSSDLYSEAIEVPDMLLRLSPRGAIEAVVDCPSEIAQSSRFGGFVGVAVGTSVGDTGVYVAITRDTSPNDAKRPPVALIGRYSPQDDQWDFAQYPLDRPSLPPAGAIVLSEITETGDGRLAVLERDNLAGLESRIKRIYSIELDPNRFGSIENLDRLIPLNKSLVRDLILAGDFDTTGGPVRERIDGMARLANDRWMIASDNRGVDRTNGETVLLRLGKIF